ncbi:helix-turn-helix domain-containing protein [Cronobacter turicensis]
MPYRKKATLHRSDGAKPTYHISVLLEQLDAHETTRDVSDKGGLRLITSSGPQCYLLIKGYVTLLRENDRLTLNTESAPFICGFSNPAPSTASLAIQLSADAVVRQISRPLALDIIKENDSWESLSHLLAYISARIFTHCTRLSHLTSYRTIRCLLEELAAEPDVVRKNVSVVSYIQSRTFVSRSRILQILAELRAGNYITLAQGKLVSLYPLPNNF